MTVTGHATDTIFNRTFQTRLPLCTVVLGTKGVTVHRSHGSVHTTVWTSWLSMSLVQQKKKYKKTPMHQARFLFIYFEQKEVEITVCSVQSDTNQLELSMAWR